VELIVLLALLMGVGAAAASGPDEQTGDEATAEEPSFFQLPDFTFPAFPAFPDTPQPQPVSSDMPYWFAETQRLFPGVPIKVGPSA